jgi:DNA invertase Pin-like site-specific DNA recombinase
MKKMIDAVAYIRTSSTTNVGEDKDSRTRQRAAIDAWAKRNGFSIAAEFYDAAVSGADLVHERPGFAAMLERLAGAGGPPGRVGAPPPGSGDGQAAASPEKNKKYILVESPDRFARDLIVQLTGHDLLKARGIELIAVNAPDFFLEDTPTAVLIRQVLGAIAQFEKASLVAKLASGRRRKKALTGRCEGRKPLAATHPGAAALAKQLRRKKPKGGVMSLRAIAVELAAAGHVNERGVAFNPRAVLELVKS